MTEWRSQLQSMRDQYRGQRYPGDLAAEILSPPRKLRAAPIAVVASLLGAAAAAVFVWTAYVPMTQDHREDPIAAALPFLQFIAMPEFPSDLPLVPAAESLDAMGGMPEFPSLDLSLSLDPEPQLAEELS